MNAFLAVGFLPRRLGTSCGVMVNMLVSECSVRVGVSVNVTYRAEDVGKRRGDIE